MARKRGLKLITLGWVGWEYDDGIQSVHYMEPSDVDEHVRRVPAELVAKYESAKIAADRAGEELLAAWTAAPDRKNPKYTPDEREGTG